MTEMLQPKWAKNFAWLSAGMTLRGWRQDAEDRRVVPLQLLEKGLPGISAISIAQQVHGKALCWVEEKCGPGVRMQGDFDALATEQPGQAVGVFTADCVPVLLVDGQARRVAAVHAGREGVRLGIVRHVLKAMAHRGSRASDIWAWIGPAICVDHYEVSQEMADTFRAAFPGWEEEAAQGRHLNLTGILALELAAFGLPESQVEQSGRCTFEEERFFSYRREGQDAGRMCSFVGIKEPA